MPYVLVVDDSLVDRRLAGRLLEGQPRYHVEYASDGLEALELVEARLPLAMVTDLHMPGLDGIQLVEAVHRKFPALPIIVMTAHGSEDVALQALGVGAADYVPKAHLASELRKAVDGVLAITAGERTHQRLSGHLRYEERRYDLPSDVRLIPPLVDELQRAAADLGLVDESQRVRLARALVEALRNAVAHGTPDGPTPESARRVHLRAAFSPEEARFVIRDEGPGFDTARLPDVKADPSPLTGGGGHGLVLIQMFMDEVSFNPAGNEITMVKRRKSAEGGGSQASA